VPTRVASRSANPPFDWSDQSGWDAVLDGVTAVYVSYAPDLAIPGATEFIRALVERAVEKGVQRLVPLSGRGEEEAQLCESIVQDAGIEWTVVRASWFNQNFSEGEFLEMVLAGAITLPAGDVPEPFLGAFIATAVLSLLMGGLALTGLGRPSATFFLGGVVFYLVGTFLVTMLGNVPLNERLAAVPATNPAALEVWKHYLGRWTMWNHVRTASAMIAALLFSLGLMQNAGA
jgi:hypothetical protein